MAEGMEGMEGTLDGKMTHYIVLRNCPTLLADREGRWYSFSRMPEAFHIPTISTNLASWPVPVYHV